MCGVNSVNFSMCACAPLKSSDLSGLAGWFTVMGIVALFTIVTVI